jgi:hypothetical protein
VEGFQTMAERRIPVGRRKPCAPTGNAPIYRAQVGRALAAAIEDPQWMLDEHQLGHDATEASWPRQPDDGNDQRNE